MLPERLAREQQCSGILNEKEIGFLNDVIVLSFSGAFVHICVLFSCKGRIANQNFRREKQGIIIIKNQHKGT